MLKFLYLPNKFLVSTTESCEDEQQLSKIKIDNSHKN